MPTTAPHSAGASKAALLTDRILYRDGDMLILDKPPGIAVHKGPGRGDNLEAHFHELMCGLPTLPGLAHRLDKDTSGCLVLGRHPKALAALNRLFAAGRVEKTYWAVATGRIAGEAGRIAAPLARRSHDRRSWWMQVSADGDPSVTDWRVLGRADGLVWLELRPLTGRTHQLRVHLAHLGLPIAGDHVYGGDRALAAARYLHLHARAISLPLDPRAPVSAIAPPPRHMHTLLEACGWVPDV